MVRFGHIHRSNRHHQNGDTLGKNSHAPAPSYMDAPGNMYTSKRKKEVDADGDLDELIAQEIQRYEELFDHGNRAFEASPDDDTLQDGSIYTSAQSQQRASSPTNNNNNNNTANTGTDTEPVVLMNDDSSRWGLEHPPCEVPPNTKVAKTSLLKPHEAAAAQACSPVRANKKKQSNNNKAANNSKSFVPPVPVLPVEQQEKEKEKEESTDPPGKKKSHGGGSNNNNSSSNNIKEKKAPATPPVAAIKKTKKPSFPRRLLFGGTSSSNNNPKNLSTAIVPSTPSTLPTPRSTKALSTKDPSSSSNANVPANKAPSSSSNNHGPKIKFFAPGKKFFYHPSKSGTSNRIQHPRNLVMAAAFVHPKSVKRASQQSSTVPNTPATTTAAAMIGPKPKQPHHQRNNHPSPPPSPPPPIDHCVIRCGDGASVISTQSSLTDALDAWLVHNTPPKIIGGSHYPHSQQRHHQQEKVSPLMLEAYEGRLIPYTAQEGDDMVDEEASAASPGALLLTEEGLYFHNHHGKSLSPVRIVQSESEDLTPAEVIQDNLVAMVWADKEQRALMKESKALAHADVIPEDAADMQVVKVLGLHGDGNGNEGGVIDASINVKRNLFGAVVTDDKDDDNTQLDVSLAPLQHVMNAAAAEEEEEEDDAEQVVVAMDDHHNIDDERVALALQHAEYHPENHHHHHHTGGKPSKFKRFLSKLVTNPKMKQLQQEAQVQRLLEQERARAKEAQLERQRREREETKRIHQKRQKELERQRKLELGSHGEPQSHTSQTGVSTCEGSLDVDPVRPRSFSLLSGEMKPDPQQGGSLSSYTAEITSFPTVNTAPSSSPSLLESPNQALPAAYSSPLVNFQFHRREGVKLFTMAYSVDTSERDGIKWKDVVNRAWKQDRKLVKSGVFSAIELDRILMIRQGQLEMRFELPYWGKHASQTLGPKTLDLLLDVVGPQRPVMVTITIEEPHLALGVDEEEAMAALF